MRMAAAAHGGEGVLALRPLLWASGNVRWGGGSGRRVGIRRAARHKLQCGDDGVLCIAWCRVWGRGARDCQP